MKRSLNWSKILLEAGMIVLSVLLALFINEWKSNYNRNVETEQMISNIMLEIETNQVFVENLATYHATVLENINQALMNDELEETFLENGYFDILKVAPRGIIQGSLQDIAWVVAKEEQISNRINLDDAQLLYSVYTQQERVSDTIRRIINMLNTREIHRKELLQESAIILGIEINEARSQEEELLYKYEQVLAKLAS